MGRINLVKNLLRLRESLKWHILFYFSYFLYLFIFRYKQTAQVHATYKLTYGMWNKHLSPSFFLFVCLFCFTKVCMQLGKALRHAAPPPFLGGRSHWPDGGWRLVRVSVTLNLEWFTLTFTEMQEGNVLPQLDLFPKRKKVTDSRDEGEFKRGAKIAINMFFLVSLCFNLFFP